MADVIYVPKSDILDLITKEHESGGFTDYSNYSNLWDEVDDMPAADVQPVLRGKWESEHYNEMIQCYEAYCSECGYASTDEYHITDNHKYCEYCGARMDGDE